MALRGVRTFFSLLSKYPLLCTWQATYRCNFRCQFCNYWKLKPDPQKELKLIDFKVGAEKLKLLGVSIISMAGGEPLLREDLPEIIKTISPLHYVYITSNGFLINEKKAKSLFAAGLDGINISIDFSDSHLHDQQRGVENAYSKAIEAIKILVRNRISSRQRVNLFAVLNAMNLSQVEALIKLARELGANFTLQPYCNLKTGKDEFSLKKEVSSMLLKLQKKYTNFISNPEALKKIDEYITTGGVGKCKAGQLFFNIDSFGNISHCVEFMDHPVGNIKELKIKEIKEKLTEAYIKNNCNRCWYNCRSEVESVYTPRGFFYRLLSIIKI